MSVSQQFSYPSYPTPTSPLAPAQLLPPSSSSSSSPGMSSPCCENGRTLVNPHTGQSVCSCQYPPSLLTYSRMGLPEPVYPSPAYSSHQSYVPLGTDPSAFYPPLNSPYDLKEAGETWRGLGQSPACYPYDPTSMPAYPYPNSYGGMDINSAARRKNATRENTNTLKAWLYEHRKNPYPTKGEKIMLAIITKMTLTQVSTWFANARRRLKKENKMTWSPRNKPGGDNAGDDDDDDDDDEGKEKSGQHDSDDEERRGENSPPDEKKSCDREGQLADDVTEQTSSTSTMRTVHMYGSTSTHNYQHGDRSAHLSRGPFPPLPQPRLHDFAPPPMSETTPPSFLNLPSSFGAGGSGVMTSSVASSSPSSNGNVLAPLTSPHRGSSLSSHMTSYNRSVPLSSSTGGVGGHLPYPPGGIGGCTGLEHHTPGHLGGGGSSISSSTLPSTSSSLLKRPDSLCSNSNDSGLSDVTCGYGGSGEGSLSLQKHHHQQQNSHHLQQGMMDDRPKIWSLAHEATSEAGGYMSNGRHHLLNGTTSMAGSGGDMNSSGGSHHTINNNNNNNNNTVGKPEMMGSSYLLPPPPMAGPGPVSGSDNGSGYSQTPIAAHGQGQELQPHGHNSCPSPSATYVPPPPTSMDNQWAGLYGIRGSSGPTGPPSGLMGGAYSKQALPPPPTHGSIYPHHLNSSRSHMEASSGAMACMPPSGHIPPEPSPPTSLYGQQPLAGGQQGGGGY